jgi:flagellar protein FliS
MTAALSRAAATYREVDVTARSPLELVVMLYDGALGNLGQARDALIRNDLVTKRHAMSKALAIVSHLQGTLDMSEGKEVALQLDRLYTYVIDKLIEANVHKRPAAIDEAVTVLSTLRDAWSQVTSAPPARP